MDRFEKALKIGSIYYYNSHSIPDGVDNITIRGKVEGDGVNYGDVEITIKVPIILESYICNREKVIDTIKKSVDKSGYRLIDRINKDLEKLVCEIPTVEEDNISDKEILVKNEDFGKYKYIPPKDKCGNIDIEHIIKHGPY